LEPTEPVRLDNRRFPSIPPQRQRLPFDLAAASMPSTCSMSMPNAFCTTHMSYSSLVTRCSSVGSSTSPDNTLERSSSPSAEPNPDSVRKRSSNASKLSSACCRRRRFFAMAATPLSYSATDGTLETSSGMEASQPHPRSKRAAPSLERPLTQGLARRPPFSTKQHHPMNNLTKIFMISWGFIFLLSLGL